MKTNCHEKKGPKQHARFSETVQRARQDKFHEFGREDKRALKKRIVKIISRKGRVNFDKLLHKLDIAPSVLSKVLTKLERKGVVTPIEEGFKKAHAHNHCGHHGDAHHRCDNHAEKRHGIRKIERCARGDKVRHGEKGRRWGGSCSFALNRAV
nr:winged helix-turn-helix domain-containing protein [uncultured Desulfobacter sp.]